MREITFREAVREALREEMVRDPSVFIIGEDIADPFGGAYKVTLGLSDEFGLERVRNTPISENAIVGAAIGAALAGMRPVAEIMYIDFATLAMEQIVNHAAKIRYMSGGQARLPLVIRTQEGAGKSAASQHTQSLEAWFVHVPGLYVVVPSTPYDAKGLLRSSIRNDNPVLFVEHKLLYGITGPVGETEYSVPLGVADVKREGTDVTVVATSYMVLEALLAAEELAGEGVSLEVIDPRTLVPLDLESILHSVKKTNRLVVAHEAVKRGGIGAEIVASVVEAALDHLDAPPRRVGAKDAPIPFAPQMESFVIPSKNDIVEAVRDVLGNTV
jgi:pyruvate/2-oxoglutarate/acetoin dehydrogenase E1 component